LNHLDNMYSLFKIFEQLWVPKAVTIIGPRQNQVFLP
jgi:hypothetical protein